MPFGTPQNLDAVAVSSSRIDLTWDAVDDATGYDIERDAAVVVTNWPTNGYADTGLHPGTEYTYRVRAIEGVTPASQAVTPAGGSVAVTAGAMGISNFSGSGGPTAPPDVTAGPAATEIGGWDQGIGNFTKLDNAGLDRLVSKGIKMLVLDQGDLQGRAWSSDPNATYNSADGRTASTYNTARNIVYGNNTGTTSGFGNFVDRCHDRGIRVFLGCYIVNRTRGVGDDGQAIAYQWHDTATWTSVTSPGGPWYDFIAFAAAQDFDGILFDNEPYPIGPMYDGSGNFIGNARTGWGWDYAGNPNDEATTKALVRAAGVKAGTVIASFGLEVIEYWSSDASGRHNWGEDVVGPLAYGDPWVLYEGLTDAWNPQVHDDFWEGILSVPGIPKMTFWDAIFYKGPHFGSSKAGNQYNSGRQVAEWSERTAMWQVIAPNLQVVPVRWIDRGQDAFEAVMPVGTAAVLFPNDHNTVPDGVGLYGHRFADGNADDVVYTGTAYDSILQAFNTPGTVNNQPPSITNVTQLRSGSTVMVICRAQHELQIRAVRYRLQNGSSIVATYWTTMTWNRNGGTYTTNFDNAYVDCTYPIPGATAGLHVVITAFSSLRQEHSVVLALT